MAMDSLQDGPGETHGKLQLRYGEEGPQAPLLIYHPLAACLMAGLGAGLLGFAAGEMFQGTYEPQDVARRFQGAMSDLPPPAAGDRATARNAALAYAPLGALLGMYLGMAGALVRGDARRCLIAGLAGLAFGGLAGGALPAAVLPWALRLRDRLEVDPLIVGTATQLLILGPIGAAAGAAFGLGLGGVRSAPRFALFALGGALAAGLVYGAAGAAFFPLAQTDQPLASQKSARFVAAMLAAVGTATAVGLSLMGRRRSRRWSWDQPEESDAAGPDAPPPVRPAAS